MEYAEAENMLRQAAASNSQMNAGVVGVSDNCRPPSMREQLEKQIVYYRDQADKHDRAAAFFRNNPAFDEFIQLVRSGAIQF